jgi:hypothetical protein
MSQQDLIDAVRNWVHFDNLNLNLAKQIVTARNMKNTFEEKVLKLLGKTKRLRIQGALLEPSTRTNSMPLNWGLLEDSLKKYYEHENKPDETEKIIAFLKENRGSKTVTYLKKTITPDTPKVLKDK